MSPRISTQYYYRCFSESSAGGLRCGLNRVGCRLPRAQLLSHFDRHKYLENKKATALVSVSDRLMEALHRAFVKYYNFHESSAGIWIAIISVPIAEACTTTYHHAERLAREAHLENSIVFKHEYLFEWEIPEQYVVHMVSVDTLLSRGLSLQDYLEEGNCLPDLRALMSRMTELTLNPAFDGYGIGRYLGQMARCFGARAPVYEIANQILTECPERITVDHQNQWVEWKGFACYMDFEHFYWITQGIDEALSECWLADGTFCLDHLAHVEWADQLREEMEMLWDHHRENEIDDMLAGTNSKSDNPTALMLWRRQECINALIEKDAIAIGL